MKKIIALLFVSLALVACTDYGAGYEDKYKNLLVIWDDDDSSSSKEKSSSSSSENEPSSSSVKLISFSSSNLSSSSSKNELSPSSSVSSSSSSKTESNFSSSVSSSSFIKYGVLIDSRDDLTYKTVTIGQQTWMAENLNYAYNEKTSSLDSSSFCYNNSADSCSKYGRLYLWSAAMDSVAKFSTVGKGCGYGATCNVSGTVRGICPAGWHLPSFEEWYTLFFAVGGDSTAGTVLKSTSGWYDSGNGEDSYGFSILPAGGYYGSNGFEYVNIDARFWTSTEYSSGSVYNLGFYYDYANVYESVNGKHDALSVRCVKD